MADKLKSEVEHWLHSEVYFHIGIDRPANHSSIVNYMMNDVGETADPVNWTSADIAIAFRRFIEGRVC